MWPIRNSPQLTSRRYEHHAYLEGVTLALDVELVVEMTVDLLLLAVLAEETTEDADAANPDGLRWHAGISGTLALTGTGVATLGLGEVLFASTETRVNNVWLAEDETVLHQLADVSACEEIKNTQENPIKNQATYCASQE